MDLFLETPRQQAERMLRQQQRLMEMQMQGAAVQPPAQNAASAVSSAGEADPGAYSVQQDSYAQELAFDKRRARRRRWTQRLRTLAMIVLWAASMYLFYDKKNYWLTAVPATFMSAVSATYFLLGNECLGQLINHKAADGTIIYNTAVAYPIGIVVAALFLGIFLYTIKKRHTQPHYETLGK